MKKLANLICKWPFSEPKPSDLFSYCSILFILIGYWNLLILSQYSCLNIFLLLTLATSGDTSGPSRSNVKFYFNYMSQRRGGLIKHILISETLKCENVCLRNDEIQQFIKTNRNTSNSLTLRVRRP